MARLNLHVYQRLCTKRAYKYFPSGLRYGLLVRIENAHQSCEAEYSPLEGIHHHSLFEVRQALEALSSYELDFMLALDPGLSYQELSAIFCERWPYPLSFILSCAFFHLHRNFFIKKANTIKLSGLVQSNIYEAQDFLAQNYSCLKLKINAHEHEKISAISALMNEGMSLRLDANRKLNYKQALKLLTRLKHVAIEYLEEPLQNSNHLAELYEQSGVNLALDESFVASKSFEELRLSKAKYLIIKPSRFFNIFLILHLCREAIEHGFTPIFSTCFETDWSVALYALLAGLASPQHAHGIATEFLFQKDECSDLPINQAHITGNAAFLFFTANNRLKI